MGIATIRSAALLVLVWIFAGLASHITRAQSLQPTLFHVLHVEDTSVYIDVGRNLGLHEGAKLLLFHDDSSSDLTGVERLSAKPVAELKVLIVADSSAVCGVLNPSKDVQVGDVGYIARDPRPLGSNDGALIQANDHPISMGFLDGDPRDDEMEPVAKNRAAPPGHNSVRIGLDYDGTQVQGGFRATETGFQIDADMTKIIGTNWNFTGYWRSRFRETYSGINGAQIETLADRINRTYHIGLYYDSPTSAIIAGFGRLSVPGAPSLSTIDGGYFGRKMTRHLTLGIFGGSTPDPSAWDYNPNERIAGIFTNIEYGDFSGLHFSGAEGVALTMFQWQVARQFAFFENTLSWKRYLWFYNSTQVDAARVSPVPGAGSNNTGISFTSSSIRLQPMQRLNLGLDHSYSNSLPTFDPNLLGTTLLDKYIFQGLSVDARYELPYRVSVFTQIGRSKSIADAKQMWNQMYGISIGNILNSGIHADLRYSKFDSTFGQGNYRALSISRSLRDAFQLELLAGSQSLVSESTTNTASRFVTGSVTWSLGPRYFFETGYTWSKGNSMNYQQWNTMFGYRFGSFGAR